ncbi:MAG: type I restriction enzyme HsdR N-terminal domain-containing protein [Prolixibacteraceae bacterium]|nr:type I restriction enzyme HsdR N-terminal domain-containing protein [Prolixibacteraceae bacterium]
MQKLNLPEYSFKTRTTEGKQYIFDSLRKKYVRLTPEEWVRQNFVQFLISEKKFAMALMAVEAGVNINNNPQRADLVVYDRSGNPVLVAEFKAPEVKISQQTFDQIVRYNMQLKVRFLIVSNGLQHYCCTIDYAENTYAFRPEIPTFEEIL